MTSSKLMASRDVTTLLSALFSVEFMATFNTTRDVLQLGLFINLAVDCCGRVSELVAPGSISNGDKCLRWGHVEFFAFQVNGMVEISAKVAFAGLKGPGIDSKRHKTIPLRILPLELAAEDSLLQLITIGLIDGVFENISSWSDFDNLMPGPSGTRISLRESVKVKPVRALYPIPRSLLISRSRFSGI